MFDMIGNILKNLFSKPATRNHPFVKRTPYEGARGEVKGIDIDLCIFCGICARKCPADAIVVDRNEKSWEINKFRCVVCGVCAEVCPKKCIHMNESYGTPVYKQENLKCVQEPKKPKEPEKNESA